MTFAEIGKLAYFMRTSPKLKIALINGRIANAKSGGKCNFTRANQVEFRMQNIFQKICIIFAYVTRAASIFVHVIHTYMIYDIAY